MRLTAVYIPVQGGYAAHVVEVPGVNTQGATIDEARDNLHDALRLLTSTAREEDLEEYADPWIVRERLYTETIEEGPHLSPLAVKTVLRGFVGILGCLILSYLSILILGPAAGMITICATAIIVLVVLFAICMHIRFFFIHPLLFYAVAAVFGLLAFVAVFLKGG